MNDGAQCEPWVNLNLPAIAEVNRAMNALALEVTPEIRENIRERIHKAFNALWEAGQKKTDEVHGTLGRVSELLTKTANALKGEPEPLHMHDWSDLPKVALKLKQERDASVNAEMRATERAARAEECCKDDLSHPTYPEMVAQVEKLTKELDAAKALNPDDLVVSEIEKERDEALEDRAAVVTTANKACDQCQAAHDVVILRQERDEARSYGERLYQGALSRKVTCVYCGHEYPDGTPTSQDQQLTEHIKVCEKHPMRKLEQFKVLVHKQLDDWGVPTDPVPGAECRVKARLNWLETEKLPRF